MDVIPVDAETEKVFEAGNDEPKVKDKKSPAQVKEARALLARATGSEDDLIQNQRLMEVINTLFLLSDMDEATKNAKIQDAVDGLCAIDPRDELERMLAAQMIACHHAAMESFRRASLPNQTFSGRDMALKHAQKLIATYAKHLETLNKHRGKGQQKVTVEHVNVAAGGQAIVGSVESEAKKRKPSEPNAVEHRAEAPMEIIKPRKKTNARVKMKNGGNS